MFSLIDQNGVTQSGIRYPTLKQAPLSAPCGLGAAVQRDLWKAPACDQRLGPAFSAQGLGLLRLEMEQTQRKPRGNSWHH